MKLTSEDSCLPDSLLGEGPFVISAPEVESGISPFTQSAVVIVLAYLLINQRIVLTSKVESSIAEVNEFNREVETKRNSLYSNTATLIKPKTTYLDIFEK